MKKFFGVFLSLMIGRSTAFSASAATVTKDSKDAFTAYEAIAAELSLYEQTKEFVGMENVDFSNLYISEKIHVYEYSQAGFSELSEAYLLFENDKIVSLAYAVGQSNVQLMTYLAERIAATQEKEFAIVYDSTGCYVYTGTAFVPVCTSGETIETRKSLTADYPADTTSLLLSSVDNTCKLNYVGNVTGARTQTDFSCYVKYVTQNPYKNLCWAATVAMIANSINGTSLTVEDTARAYWGSIIDNTRGTDVATTFMNNTYHVSYSYKDTAPSDNTLLWNIQNGYPIYGSFLGLRDRHAVVIYGVNIIAGRIAIMDPAEGSRTCYVNSSGKYSYIRGSNGETFTLVRGSCRQWRNQ